MKLTIDAQPAPAQGATTVRFFSTAQRREVPASISQAEFSAGPNALLNLHHENLLCVGLGDPARVTAQTLRSASGAAVMFLKKIGRSKVSFDLREWPQFAGSAIEGAVLADYRYDTFKPSKAAPIESLRCIVPVQSVKKAKADAARGRVLAEATNYARRIGNQPGNYIFPKSLADEARRMATEKGLRITVLDEKALRAGKFGGLLAVGEGSMHPPRLIVLEHRGGPVSQNPIALVGKAVTFDSGGISIKPADKMEEMVFDKSGGMAVLGAMAGIADLGLKRNVIGVIASAENMPSATAFRPGDIITTYDGKFIEINNTDAEGRVVLADAIAYARKTKHAAAIVDLATLTGAIGIALGEQAAGLWSTSEILKSQLLAASEKTGERLWPMPLYPEYDEQIKSDVALIKNSAGRLGGASTGAAFLKAFAEETPWAHLDIAYTANIAKDRADLARGATGFGVRLLIELVDEAA